MERKLETARCGSERPGGSRDMIADLDQIREREAKADGAARHRPAQELGRAARVLHRARRPPLARFDPGRGEAKQPLKEGAARSILAAPAPPVLEHLVRLPVVAV